MLQSNIPRRSAPGVSCRLNTGRRRDWTWVGCLVTASVGRQPVACPFIASHQSPPVITRTHQLCQCVPGTITAGSHVQNRISTLNRMGQCECVSFVSKNETLTPGFADIKTVTAPRAMTGQSECSMMHNVSPIKLHIRHSCT